MKICSRAPVRVSFLGGGTDVSPFTELYGSKVLNVAINKYCYSIIEGNKRGFLLEELNPKKSISYSNDSLFKTDKNFPIIKCVINRCHRLENSVKVTTYSDVPPSSGLGGSASMFVSLIGAMNKYNNVRLENYDLAELAWKLEREDLGNIGGRQDQYASVFAGLSYMEFNKDDFVKVNPLKLDEDILLELQRSLLLFYIGPRESKSGNIIADQTKNVINKTETVEAMKEMKKLTVEAKDTLVKGDIYHFGEVIDESWKLKKKFSKKISNDRINKIYTALKKSGAIGGKISGAGGGGHMFVVAEPENRFKILKTAERIGIKHIPFSFDFEGLKIWGCK